MKINCLAIAAALLHLTCISQITAQQLPDSIRGREMVSNLTKVYLKGICDNAEIYHGSEYIRNGQKAIGYPFFNSDTMLTASIYYQGTAYPGRTVHYDLVSDILIINNYASNALISLSPEKVDSFEIDHHFFVLISAQKSNRLNKTGYYERLFSGEPGLFALREKKLVAGIGSEETKYIQHDDYFIEIKSVFYGVDGKTALLDVLKDQEDVLKKYIRTNKLNFKKDFESSLVLATIYYSQQKH
jgi:hypothetical protein